MRAALLAVGDRRLVELLAPIGRQCEIGRVADVVDLVAEFKHARADNIK